METEQVEGGLHPPFQMTSTEPILVCDDPKFPVKHFDTSIVCRATETAVVAAFDHASQNAETFSKVEADRGLCVS